MRMKISGFSIADNRPLSLFTFTPFLALTIIFMTFTRDQAILKVKHSGKDLARSLIAIVNKKQLLAMDHHNESSVGFRRLSVPPVHI